MTKDEIGDWFLNNDTSPLIAAAQRGAEPFVQVDMHGAPLTRQPFDADERSDLS